MLKAIYEGKLNALYRMDETAKAGLFVALDTENEGFVKVAGVDDAFGVLSEDIKDYSGEEFGGYRSPVKPIAALGDKVGVYNQGGTYRTDLFDGTKTYAPGEALYFDGAKLTNVEPVDGVVVAEYLQMAGSVMQFELKL